MSANGVKYIKPHFPTIFQRLIRARTRGLRRTYRAPMPFGPYILCAEIDLAAELHQASYVRSELVRCWLFYRLKKGAVPRDPQTLCSNRVCPFQWLTPPGSRRAGRWGRCRLRARARISGTGGPCVVGNRLWNMKSIKSNQIKLRGLCRDSVHEISGFRLRGKHSSQARACRCPTFERERERQRERER